MDKDVTEQTRNLATALEEITARLGEPLALHQTQRSGVIIRFLLGVFIVLAVAGLHYLVWSGEIPLGKIRNVKAWLLMIVAGLIGPGTGLYLITFAVRGMNMTVLAYPSGLFIWQRGRVVAFPWSEVDSVQLTGVPKKVKLEQGNATNGKPVWFFDLSASRWRLFGSTLIIRRADGETLALHSTLRDFADLARLIQTETYGQLRQQARGNGQEPSQSDESDIDCGICTFNEQGILKDAKLLSWRDYARYELNGTELAIYSVQSKKAWLKTGLDQLSNPHVLLGILQEYAPKVERSA